MQKTHAVSVGSGCCAPVGIRTPNLLIRSQMLYPLSYRRPSPTARVSDWTRIAEPSGRDEIRATPRHRAGTAGLGLEKAEDRYLEERESRSKQGM